MHKYSNNLIVFGGVIDSNYDLSSDPCIYVLSLDELIWTKCLITSSSKFTNLALPNMYLCNFSSIIVEDHLIVFGGKNKEF